MPRCFRKVHSSVDFVTKIKAGTQSPMTPGQLSCPPALLPSCPPRPHWLTHRVTGPLPPATQTSISGDGARHGKKTWCWYPAAQSCTGYHYYISSIRTIAIRVDSFLICLCSLTIFHQISLGYSQRQARNTSGSIDAHVASLLSAPVSLLVCCMNLSRFSF